MAAAASAALIVVPLTGAAAAALVTSQPVTPDSASVLEANLDRATNLADAPTEITADANAEFAVEMPTVTVQANPVPQAPKKVLKTTGTKVSNSRPVKASASVQQAIAGSAIIAYASQFVGTPYVSGGSSPSGFDCSGFVSYVYRHFGINLPTSSGAYYGVGTRVSSPAPGDIIVSSGHVGLYAGKNLQIDAPRPGKTIQFRAIWQSNPTYVRVTG